MLNHIVCGFLFHLPGCFRVYDAKSSQCLELGVARKGTYLLLVSFSHVVSNFSTDLDCHQFLKHMVICSSLGSPQITFS
jgi:hypothetical protein